MMQPGDQVPEAVASDLAPGGLLRIGVVEAEFAGAFFVARDAASGRLQGVTIDLGAWLAERIGVPVDYHVFPNSGECTEATAAAAVDVAFMPVDEVRRSKVSFGPAYYQLESTYLVSAGSGITDQAHVDEVHVRVVGIVDTTTIRAAGRTLKNTRPVPVRSVEDATSMVRDGRAEALALSRDSLQPIKAAIAGSRVLDGAFQQTGICIAVPPGRPDALVLATTLLEQAKSSGAVRAIFDRAGLRDEPVAPPADPGPA